MSASPVPSSSSTTTSTTSSTWGSLLVTGGVALLGASVYYLWNNAKPAKDKASQGIIDDCGDYHNSTITSNETNASSALLASIKQMVPLATVCSADGSHSSSTVSDYLIGAVIGKFVLYYYSLHIKLFLFVFLLVKISFFQRKLKKND